MGGGSSSPSFDRLEAVRPRRPRDGSGREAGGFVDVEAIFGENTFGPVEMERRLPGEVFQRLMDTLDAGAELDLSIADPVAEAMKEWAEERGATHYTHWFQPLTGYTAEKHDSFLTPTPRNPGQALTRFSGRDLVRGEPSASSLPSGGLRTTFEARGYTAWDPTSAAFVVGDAGGATLCIPTAYSSWSGDALDQKIPLLRSLRTLEQEVRAALVLFGEEPGRVRATAGTEQEFFLVDEEFFYRRPDLITAGRTLFGARPPKGQELEDHYFGAIPDRVLEYMTAVEVELYRLGVPVKTRHNEVAPGQFEMALVYEDANVAADHQQIMMSTLRRVARPFGLVCLLHEKPFAGVSGSGKHLNWSLYHGNQNLLDPGKTPHENLQFLFFSAAVVRAVDRHPDLLRASVAYAANDLRLGGQEAPPALLSVFLGDQLTDLFEQIAEGGTGESPAEGGLLGLGVPVLPELPKHAGDRNRTSPFAFTGEKFEFRSLGASQSVSFPITVLNTIVAESVRDLRGLLEEEIEGEGKLDGAMRRVLARSYPTFRRIVFNGDGYSEAWAEEAEKRGLRDLSNTLDALPVLVRDKNADLFEGSGVLSRRELESRYDIALQHYFHTVNIEGETGEEVVATLIVPATVRYLSELLEGVRRARDSNLKAGGLGRLAREVADLLEELEDHLTRLRAANEELGGDDVTSKVVHMREGVLPALEAVRERVDRLERRVADDLWPLPSYRDLLFLR